jgi:hypothetical protein
MLYHLLRIMKKALHCVAVFRVEVCTPGRIIWDVLWGLAIRYYMKVGLIEEKTIYKQWVI